MISGKEKGMEQFVTINKAVNGFVWGPVMLALLVGTGVYLSVAVGFIQFSKIGYWWKNTIFFAFTCSIALSISSVLGFMV